MRSRGGWSADPGAASREVERVGVVRLQRQQAAAMTTSKNLRLGRLHFIKGRATGGLRVGFIETKHKS